MPQQSLVLYNTYYSIRQIQHLLTNYSLYATASHSSLLRSHVSKIITWVLKQFTDMALWWFQ